MSSPRTLWEQVWGVAWRGGECAWGGVGAGVRGDGSSAGNRTLASPTSGGEAARGGILGVVVGVTTSFDILL